MKRMPDVSKPTGFSIRLEECDLVDSMSKHGAHQHMAGFMNWCSQPSRPEHAVPTEPGRKPVLSDSLKPMNRHGAHHQRGQQGQTWKQVWSQRNESLNESWRKGFGLNVEPDEAAMDETSLDKSGPWLLIVRCNRTVGCGRLGSCFCRMT